MKHLLSIIAFLPGFMTHHDILIFLVVPKGPPVIANADQVFFKVGDWLNLNCTSQASRPPTRLTWLVNGVEVIYHIPIEKTPNPLVVEARSMIHQNPLLNSFPSTFKAIAFKK